MKKEDSFLKETGGFSLKDIVQGRLISNDIFLKQWKNIATCLILIFIYISNGYTCQQKMAEIGRLQRELTDVRFDALTLSSDLVGVSRQSQVKRLIVEKGIDLQESTQPPYVLKR